MQSSTRPAAAGEPSEVRTALEPLLTVDELAQLARQSRRTIERRIADDTIPTVHLGPHTVRIRLDEARRYLGG